MFGDWAITETIADKLVERLDELKPKTILECGSGVSTLVMGTWAEKNGSTVVALEHQPSYLDKSRTMCAHLSSVEIAFAPIDRKTRCYSAKNLPFNIEFALIDGPPANIGRQTTLPLIWSHLTAKAEIWLDDANREHEQKCLKAWENKYDIDVKISSDEKGLAIIKKR